jgi:cytochrome c-type biogenesis protein CcmH
MIETDPTFLFVAAVLGAVAVAVLLIPSWLHRRKNGQWCRTCVVSAVLIVPAAAFLYGQVTTWNPAEAARASEAVRIVELLASRMQENPDDVRGWRLLGNSYMQMGQYVQARAAFAEAWQRTPLPDNALKVELAESQVFAEAQGLTGRAIRLFEEVLISEPTNQKALWYAALAAEQLGNTYVARRNLSKLLEQTLPSDIRSTVERKLAALPPDTLDAARASDVVLTAEIELASQLASYDIGPQAMLFLIARAASDGPPVAVVRHPASAIPGEFTLSNANSMAGQLLTDYETLRLIARVSLTGQAEATKGDLQGEVMINTNAGRVALVVDSIVP